ncbi:MAG: thioredoxin family protein [Bacteroidetes bacterium]|nr:thioredoxin family protein [Bacteroidota bacterium]
MKNLLFILVVLVGYEAIGQMNSTVVDINTGEKMLMGYCDKKGLEKGVYGAYFDSQYDIYNPSDSYISKISDKIDEYEITIVLGTWCIDSKKEVPHFYKVLNEAGYNDKRVKVIAVNKRKEAILVDINDLNIERVPTMIIYKDDKEVGRIIESPKKSHEQDLWKIIR